MSDRSDLTNGLVAAVIARGDSLARKGKYRRAIRVWRKLLEQEGEEVELAKDLIRGKIAAAYFRLSRLALRGRPIRKAWLRAAERLRLAVKYETHPDYQIELARCYLKLGQLERADETLAGLLGPDRTSEKALYYGTVVKIRLGDLAGAQVLIKRGFSLNGLTQTGWWERLMALCAALEGDFAKALSIARTPYEGVPSSVWFEDVTGFARSSTPSLDVFGALDAILDALDDRDVKEWAREIGSMIGDILAHLGKDEEAVQYWTDAADGEAGHPLLERVASTCAYRILEAIKQRALDDASKWRRIGIESGVEEAIQSLEGIVHLNLAKEAWVQGDFRGAASGFAAALRWKPSAEMARNLALAYEAHGDWTQAADAWQRAYSLATSDRSVVRREASRRQGLAYLLAGSLAEARAALQRAFEIEEDEEIALLLGCIMIALGDYVAAASHLVRAVESNIRSPRLLVSRAIAIELAEHSLNEKVVAWKQASRASGEEWVYGMWRSRLLAQGDFRLKEGQLDDALACYIDLLIEDLDDRECWVRCGAVHLKGGRTAQAEKCFAEARKEGDAIEIGRLIAAVKRERSDPGVVFTSLIAAGDEADDREMMISWAQKELEITGSLDPADVERLLETDLPLPDITRPSLREYEQRLPVQRILSHEPMWN